jgi:hypothetical protein
MITIEQCKIFSGLVSDEMVMGAVPSARHRSRLSGYLLNLKWGSATVREMIVADIRAALDLGALNRAADLLVVLRLFLSDHPDARRRNGRQTQDCSSPRSGERTNACERHAVEGTRTRSSSPIILVH